MLHEILCRDYFNGKPEAAHTLCSFAHDQMYTHVPNKHVSQIVNAYNSPAMRTRFNVVTFGRRLSSMLLWLDSVGVIYIKRF